MTRSEFYHAFDDWDRAQHPGLNMTKESVRHSAARIAASLIWQRSKIRLKRLTADEWRREQTKKAM